MSGGLAAVAVDALIEFHGANKGVDGLEKQFRWSVRLGDDAADLEPEEGYLLLQAVEFEGVADGLAVFLPGVGGVEAVGEGVPVAKLATSAAFWGLMVGFVGRHGDRVWGGGGCWEWGNVRVEEHGDSLYNVCNLMPAYPRIEQYYADMQRLMSYSGSVNEQSIRPAFQNCLSSYCRAHRENLELVPELRTINGVIPDGTVKDSLRMPRGYWEAKDSHDDLDTEIQRKFNRGYPRDNIIFEDSQTAVLFQNREEAMRVDMSRSGELHRLIRAFLDYELPEIEEFRRAQQQFKADLPEVISNLREAVEEAEINNAEYREAAASFLELCHRAIGPKVSNFDVKEMLLQHILTKDIFLRVFGEDQFHRENNIARQLEVLEQTFFTGEVRREAIDRLRAYYGVIGRAASDIADYAEKQQFLKAIYEDFYQAYNPEAADYLGVVYTPNEVVNFIIRGTDHLLQRHFGRSLGDRNVQILDPATGTGTFVTNLIDYMAESGEPDALARLEHKYRNELHANEVAILPYYIANLNIEYTYREKTGCYLEFPNLVFVDTLDNVDWQGATGGAVERQSRMDLGALSEENWIRLQEQNEKTISVIMGNPPYNANAILWGDGRDNWPYPEVDKRIKETYVKQSSAQKTKQYDMYKRFIRWASDRLADDGIISFITNNAYLSALQDDGFRKVMPAEFSDLYIIDLGGNFQKGKRPGNVFGIKIGVAIGFFVRKANNSRTANIHYCAITDEQSSQEKLSALKDLNLEDITLETIDPDDKGNWFDKPNTDFRGLLPLVTRDQYPARDGSGSQALSYLHSLGVSTNRDEWVYDFNGHNLKEKVRFFSDTYNDLIDRNDESLPTTIKWSSTLRDRFRRGDRFVYDEGDCIESLYRPFTVRQYFAHPVLSDRLTRNHYEMFGADLKQQNLLICFNGPGSSNFAVLGANKLVEKKYCDTNNNATFCLPLYRYTDKGERISNITQWGIDHINNHYEKEWGKDFKTLYPSSITAEHIFAYAYAVLHAPVYRDAYAVDLTREFPRLPLYHDFGLWAKMGQELLDLHIGFESAEPYPLKRINKPGDATKVILRPDKELGSIILDDKTTLIGVPPDAWRYRLGSRSALEWVLDQYKEKKPRDPTIAEKFNTYRFADYKEQVIDLLQRVCTVSVRTMEIVDGMARYHAAGAEDSSLRSE